MIYSKGIFPDILKVGKITPIYKHDHPELLEIIGPIFGKLFEKGIYKRLYSYLVSQNLMTPLPIWFSERSFNQPRTKSFYQPYLRSSQKEGKKSPGNNY